jgi:hypothetical protein
MYLECIDALDGPDGLNSFILARGDDALAEAAQLDEQQASGRVIGPLHGVPLGVKNNLFTKGTVTSAATEVLDSFVPDRDATVVRLLKSAGADPGRAVRRRRAQTDARAGQPRPGVRPGNFKVFDTGSILFVSIPDGYA